MTCADNGRMNACAGLRVLSRSGDGRSMPTLAHGIDRMNRAVAGAVRWLALVMVLAQFCIVIGRYVFGVNSIAAQESVLYIHAALFMLGAGFTLLVDRHVRVDDITPARALWCGGASTSSAISAC